MRSRPEVRETRPLRFLPALALVVLVGCSTDRETGSGNGDWYREVQEQAGVSFTHTHGGTGERYMVETMGSGGGFLDFDNDGWLDLYLVQAGSLEDPSQRPGNRLFRNLGDGTFEDRTDRSGTGDTGYGMGNCYGDIDNDGFIDIYLTNFGEDRLLLNRGDGTFADSTEAAGLGDPGWGSGCAFADYDGDGCLDLYVVRYVDFRLDNHRPCGSADLPMYCHPDAYRGLPDLLYRNRCDGTFEEVSAAAGVANDDPRQSKGLGVVWADVDDDGDLDLYVANDSTRNFLYRNEGDGTFVDIGTRSGTAFNELGRTEAGMGVDAGDLDGDGLPDLFVTNLDFETNTLYHNLGDGQFSDATTMAGLAANSLTFVGFGTNMLDVDNDGHLDLFIANGHILDNVEQRNSSLRHAQPDRLFFNLGDGRMVDRSPQAGSAFAVARVGRGSAVGDVDNDGDLDLLVTHCNQPAVLLRNEIGADRGHWLALRLVSRHGGRDATGAQVLLSAGGKQQLREVRNGSGYLSQSDLRLHFGLGQESTVEGVEIRWPDGSRSSIPGSELSIDSLHVLHQPGAEP